MVTIGLYIGRMSLGWMAKDVTFQPSGNYFKKLIPRKGRALIIGNHVSGGTRLTVDTDWIFQTQIQIHNPWTTAMELPNHGQFDKSEDMNTDSRSYKPPDIESEDCEKSC